MKWIFTFSILTFIFHTTFGQYSLTDDDALITDGVTQYVDGSDTKTMTDYINVSAGSSCNNLASEYIMNFENSDDLTSWVYVDANNDGSRWILTPDRGIDTSNCASYEFNSTNNADDWLISPCFDLDTGRIYELNFYYAVESSSYPEKLKVAFGDSQNSTSMTNLISDLGMVNNEDFIKSSNTFTVNTNGTYYFGWQCYSNADMSYLHIDSISIKEVVVVPIHTVTFNDWDTSLIATQTIESGNDAIAPTDPIRNGYSFIGWDTDFTNITNDLTITATYSINNYTVTFADWDNTQLKLDTVEHGSVAIAPSDPIRDDYTFTGWDKTFDNIIADLIVTAQYTEDATPTYTVTFNDWDDTILKTEDVDEGSSATAPADPTRDGFTFTGWDKAFDNIIEDITITAQYTEDGVAVNENNENTVSIYPNPTSSELNVNFASSATNLMLIDFSGKIIYQNNNPELLNNVIRINVSKYPQGVYLLKIENNGQTHIHKAIKN